MEGYIERMFLAGVGALTLTKEKAEKTMGDLVKKGEVAKKDQPEFVKRLLERGKASRAEIEKIVEKTVKNVLDKLNVPTKSDIDALMKKTEELKKK